MRTATLTPVPPATATRALPGPVRYWATATAVIVLVALTVAAGAFTIIRHIEATTPSPAAPQTYTVTAVTPYAVGTLLGSSSDRVRVELIGPDQAPTTQQSRTILTLGAWENVATGDHVPLWHHHGTTQLYTDPPTTPQDVEMILVPASFVLAGAATFFTFLLRRMRATRDPDPAA